MHVRCVTLLREGAYGFDGETVDPTKPFVCKVSIVGQTGKHELLLPPEVSTHIMYLIAEELADAGKRVADMMRAEAFTEQGEQHEGVELPAPAPPQVPPIPQARDLDDEIPF